MARTGKAAAQFAKSYVGRAAYSNYCKQFVRTVLDVEPSRSPSAIGCWNIAKFKHRVADPNDVPAYVPVFFDTASRFEHVAFTIGKDAAGKRLCVTTDASNGRIGIVRVEDIHRRWGPVIGWTEDFDGVRVCTPPKPVQEPPKDDSVLRSGSSGPKVRTLQKGLRETFPAYRNDVAVKRGTLLAVDGEYGAQTKAWVQEFQRRAGLKVDGIVAATTKKALAGYGVKI